MEQDFWPVNMLLWWWAANQYSEITDIFFSRFQNEGSKGLEK